MKRKRLNRDTWGFQAFPYYQMRIDHPFFHGEACLIKLVSGDYYYWDKPIAGKVPVCGAGMVWLQLIPDGVHHIITVKFIPKEKYLNGKKHPYQVSVWYVDMIETTEYDPDGVMVFIDQYLDVIFTPQGDVKIDDRDELDEAYQGGELSQEQYQRAIAEGDMVIQKLCSDILSTEIRCTELLNYVMNCIMKEDNYGTT